MPLVVKQGNILVTADTNDILSSHTSLKNAGTGVYKVWARAAAAADATITINDGDANVVDGEPIITGGAGTTYPDLDLSKDIPWTIKVTSGERIKIDILDGTSGEIIVKVVKVK